MDFVKKLVISILDYGISRTYSDQWGCNHSCGDTRIKDHDSIGAQVNKPVVLEEYGAQGPKTTTVEQ